MRLRACGFVLPVALVAACSSGPGPIDPRPYLEEVRAARAEKDAMFASSADSPIPLMERTRFTALSYYEIDPTYRVPAFLKEDRSGPPVIIELPTSTNQRRKMRTVGTLGFSLGATRHTLTAFADADTRSVNRLFVPFGDLTNKKETYGGGRYLDLERTPTGLYDLDFNRAYNPYCVYNIAYDCPVPPQENRLHVEIRAGERMADK